jgi:hypothetical protein
MAIQLRSRLVFTNLLAAVTGLASKIIGHDIHSAWCIIEFHNVTLHIEMQKLVSQSTCHVDQIGKKIK